MGIYSRSYMRNDHPRGGGRSLDALKTILISLVAVFVVQKILQIGFADDPRIDVLAPYLGLSLGNLTSGLIYTFLTYGYLHSSGPGLPWHLLINGFIIWMAGRYLRMRMSDIRLYEFFHFCVLAGGLAWIPVVIWQGNPAPLIGASAAGFGFLALFALFMWNETMRLLLFFILPITMTGRTLFWILLGAQGFFFLFNEVPGNMFDNTAYSAHLGGIGMAFLYHRHLLHRQTFWSWIQGKKTASVQKPAWQQRGEAARKKGAGRFKLNIGGKPSGPSTPPSSTTTADPGSLRAEVDRILDKINSKGFGSLSAAEKRTLDEAKDRLN